MMDDDPQARELREGLDRELAGLRATAAARELLTSRIAASASASAGDQARPGFVRRQLAAGRGNAQRRAGHRPLGTGRGNAQPRPGRRPLVSAVGLPLAAAAVLVAVVVVPSYLRSESRQPQPGGVPVVTGPASAPPEPTAAHGSATPTPAPTASAVPEPGATTPAGPLDLTLTVRPKTAGPGQPVTLVVLDSSPRARAAAVSAPATATGSATSRSTPEPTPAAGATPTSRTKPTEAPAVPVRSSPVTTSAPSGQLGVMTVTWGDGSEAIPLRGSCGRSVVPPHVPAHVYRRPGEYRITAVLDRCDGTTGHGQLTLSVLVARPSAVSTVK